jgi:succinyl-diaminopimelate desuccinylase
VSATRIAGGIADNVIPDRVDVALNYRYATGPHREAPRHACANWSARRELEITSNSPPARVATDSRS